MNEGGLGWQWVGKSGRGWMIEKGGREWAEEHRAVKFMIFLDFSLLLTTNRPVYPPRSAPPTQSHPSPPSQCLSPLKLGFLTLFPLFFSYLPPPPSSFVFLISSIRLFFSPFICFVSFVVFFICDSSILLYSLNFFLAFLLPDTVFLHRLSFCLQSSRDQPFLPSYPPTSLGPRTLSPPKPL